MKRIKRGVTLLLCLCLALSLCACGGGKKDTAGGAAGKSEADTPPEKETAAPSSDGPLPLSQYIRSSETQILYKDDEMDKNARPWVFLIRDGTVTTANPKITFGELSRMSDEEIIQAVSTEEENPKNGPCLVYLETGSSGNTVKSEILWYYNSNDQIIYDMEFGGMGPQNGVIYDSTYTGYRTRDGFFYVARGEQVPFVLDEIGAEGVEIDPNREKQAEMRRSIVRIELVDGTQISPPEASGDGTITSCALTGGGQRTLSLDDVQFILIDSRSDFSPSVLNTAEGLEALITGGRWYTDYGKIDFPIPAHTTIALSAPDGSYITYYNDSDTERSIRDITLSGMGINVAGFVELRTGELRGLDDLIREYGSPSGAVMKWTSDTVRADIVYCWSGEGFYILYDKRKDLLMYRNGTDEHALDDLIGLKREDLAQVCEEAVRLLSN